MAEPLKFTFNTAFGTRSENQAVNENLPIITQDDVDGARTQGFIQGREDGLAEANAQNNAEMQSSFEKISTNLEALLSNQAQTAQDVRTQSQNFALLIAQKIAKSALINHPTDQIKTLVEECLAHINLMPHLVIRVNQEIVEYTKNELQPLFDEKGFEGKLIILGEEDIARGDCKIEWADGGVAHNTTEIVQKISNLITECFGFDAETIAAEQLPENAVEPAPVEIIEEEEVFDDEEDIFSHTEEELEPELEAKIDTASTELPEEAPELETEPEALAEAITPEPEIETQGFAEEGLDDIEFEDDDFLEIVTKKTKQEIANEQNQAETDLSLEGQTNE